MTESSPREVALGFFHDLNEQKPDAAFARLAPEVDYNVMAPPPHGGPCDAAGLGQKAFAVFERLAAPLKLQTGMVVADGEHVVVEVKGNGMTRQGGNYDNDFLFLFRVVGGKIVMVREFLDSAKYVDLMEGRL